MQPPPAGTGAKNFTNRNGRIRRRVAQNARPNKAREAALDFVNLSIHLVSGVLGGNLLGGGSRDLSQGVGGNSLLGACGGALGGLLLNQLGVGTGPLDVLTLLVNILAGGGSGALLTFVVGACRFMLTR